MATIASLIVNLEANTVKLAAGMDTMQRQIEGIASVASKAGSLLTSAFTVTAIAGIVKDTIAFAGELEDLAARTGMSTRELQRLAYVGDEVGVSLDQVAISVGQMQNRLAGGDSGALEAVTKLGLSLQTLRAMDPGQQFEAIAAEIAKIPDPAERTRVAIEVFGKSGAAILPLLRENIKSTGDEMERLGLQIAPETGRVLDWLGDKFSHLGTIGIAAVAHFIDPITTLIPKMTEDLRALGLVSQELAKAPAAIPLAQPKAAEAIHLSDAALREVTKTLDDQRKVLDEAAEKARQHADAIGRIRDQLTGRGAIRAALDMNEALRGALPIQALDDEAKKQINKTMGEAIEAYKRFGEVVPPAMNQAYILTMQMPPAVRGITNAIKDLGHEAEVTIPTLYDLPKPIDSTSEALDLLLSKSHRVLVDLMPTQVKSLGALIKDNLLGVLKSIPQTNASAITGGGGTAGAIKSIASGVGAAVGSAVGTSIGGPLGGAIGSAIGSLAGPLVGQIGKWLGIGATEYEKRMKAAAQETMKLQQQLLSSHGGMAQLIIDADLVGINIKEAFNWKDPEALKNIVGELDQKTQLLNSAMQEYGFTWEDLGEKARGAKLAQLFDDLYAKTDILRTAGIDYHTILERQADDYSKLVQSALRTGTEIPAAMQPVLQDLVDMGKLVDANGNAFTDLSDLHWAKTLTQGFDEVTGAIRELTDAITRGVGGALDDIGRRVVHPKIQPEYTAPGVSASDNDPGYASGTPGLGFVNFGTRKPTWLHGDEAVIPRHKVGDLAAQIAAAMGGGGGGDIHITLDAGDLGKQMVKIARKDAAKGGIRQRATVGRSY